MIAIALLFSSSFAQRRPRPKNPRAIALVEWPAKGKPRVVPIAILDEGRFHDASIYQADPVPMAIDYGVVYEVQKSGEPVGFATIDQVLTNNQGAFAAEAKYQSNEDIAKAKAARRHDTAVRPDPDEGPPRLRKAGSKKETKPAETTPPQSQTTSEPDDDARPRLHRSGEAAAPPQEEKKTAPEPPAPAPEEAAHPRLRRGGDEEQAASLPGGVNVSAGARRAPSSLMMPKNDGMRIAKPVRVLPAISDATRGLESRTFVMPGQEKTQPHLQSGMEVLARDALIKFATARSGQTPGALQGIEVRAFDLALTNQATVVLMATAHPAPAPAAPPKRGRATRSAALLTPMDRDLTYWVTVIARENYDGQLIPLKSWVTDSRHLDAWPRMELIDAIDADGDGRGELLFRRWSDRGRGFVIDRIAPAQVIALYDSSEPEQ